MPKITIQISEEVKKVLTRRAKKNFLSLKEQIEEILRKSAVRTKSKANEKKVKVEDRLVAIFSRDRRGRKSKKRRKKKEAMSFS